MQIYGGLLLCLNLIKRTATCILNVTILTLYGLYMKPFSHKVDICASKPLFNQPSVIEQLRCWVNLGGIATNE